MTAILEHANICVTNPQETAAWMKEVFGWHIRWEGPAINDGYSVHCGSGSSYVALYRPGYGLAPARERYREAGALNHLAVIVDDIDATEQAVKAQGFVPKSHADYEPGRRFYFLDDQGVEYEVVQYD